jgi:hypothetical protein
MKSTFRWRKLLLAVHVASSVGWFGSLAVFIVLAVVGRTSNDAELVRASYLAMKLAALYVILPFSLIALVTGIVQALVTPWGLGRHYWVILKLVLTSVAAFLLAVHITPVTDLSNYAVKGTLSQYSWMRTQILAYACGGLLVVSTSMALAVFKPRGLTRWGRRALSAAALTRAEQSAPVSDAAAAGPGA